MNYVSRSRKSGLAAQFYNFVHNLSEVARSRDDVVLAVSIPSLLLEVVYPHAIEAGGHCRGRRQPDLPHAVLAPSAAGMEHTLRARCLLRVAEISAAPEVGRREGDHLPGLDSGVIAYVGRGRDGVYEPFVYKRSLASREIEFSDDVFLIQKDRAEAYVASKNNGPTIG